MERPRLQTPEIKAVADPMENLAAQLSLQVQNRAYALVVGDDYSGRIPALVFGRAINYSYASRRLPAVPSLFVKTGNVFCNYYPPLERFQHQGRALVITEAVAKGLAIKDFESLFRAYWLEFDMAAVTTKLRPTDYCGNRFEQIRGSTTIFAGSFGTDNSPLLHKMKLTGLRKKPVGVRVDYPNRAVHLRAMRDVQTLATYLANRYFIP